MQDIDHFSEEKMFAAKSPVVFSKSLPEPLRSIFKNVSKGHSISVLQGYRGPSRLTNGKSGDSSTEEEYLGVHKVAFWFAVSKHWNWVPVFGNIFFGIARAVESMADMSDWTYLYFNAGTGEMIDVNLAEWIQYKNRKAEKHYENVEKLMATGKYEEAAKEATSALEICSVAYKRMTLFKEASDKAACYFVCKIEMKKWLRGDDNDDSSHFGLFVG